MKTKLLCMSCKWVDVADNFKRVEITDGSEPRINKIICPICGSGENSELVSVEEYERSIAG